MGDYMKRTIYNFYCYRCLKQNIAVTSYPLDIDNGKIIRIYCPCCQAWIPYTDTNLSENRYKLVHRNDWCILDEDTPRRQIIYTVKMYETAHKICNSLNNGTLTVSRLYHHLYFLS